MTSRTRLVALPRTLHTTDRPSRTAQWTTLARALELRRVADERIVSDAYAPVFLSGLGRRVLPPLTSAAPLLTLAERSALLGIAASALCRHAFLDAHLLEALPEVDQVLILGAGYDGRAYRFAQELDGRRVFEVDLAPLSRGKAEVVAAHPELFGHGSVERVEIDFRTQSLQGRLAGSRFALGAPTFVAWEGVSPYLTRSAVLETLHALALVCGRGSALAMDFWQPVGGIGPYARLRSAAVHAMRLIGEPVTFAIRSGEAPALLRAAGFGVRDLAVAERMTARYATDGRRCDQGMYVVAAQLE